MTMGKAERILVIDDNLEIGEFVTAAAQHLGLSCVSFASAAEFLDALTPDITMVVMDLLMPEMDGIELLRELAGRRCTAGIVLMSGTGKRIIETAEQLARTTGLTVVGKLQKPFHLAELEAVLNRQHISGIHLPPQRAVPIAGLDDDLYHALEREEFVLHYQPQIELATDKLVGVEALVRWQHPQRGLIYPDEFIGRAESLGLIDRLGWFVARRGLDEVSLFIDEEGFVPRLSVNVSVYSLRDLKFPDIYSALLASHHASAQNTTLEITESGLIQELANTLDVLTRLRLKQVNLSIDDFGTGYSMMQQLRHIPATELKIDKFFVQNIFTTDSARVMVQKTIEIGHELGMKVIAEGVETHAQLKFLRDNRCDVVQGYLFSKPLPVEQMQVWVRKYRAGAIQV